MLEMLLSALATAKSQHVQPDVSCGTTCYLRNLATSVKLAWKELQVVRATVHVLGSQPTKRKTAPLTDRHAN